MNRTRVQTAVDELADALERAFPPTVSKQHGGAHAGHGGAHGETMAERERMGKLGRRGLAGARTVARELSSRGGLSTAVVDAKTSGEYRRLVRDYRSTTSLINQALQHNDRDLLQRATRGMSSTNDSLGNLAESLPEGSHDRKFASDVWMMAVRAAGDLEVASGIK